MLRISWVLLRELQTQNPPLRRKINEPTKQGVQLSNTDYPCPNIDCRKTHNLQTQKIHVHAQQ